MYIYIFYCHSNKYENDWWRKYFYRYILFEISIVDIHGCVHFIHKWWCCYWFCRWCLFECSSNWLLGHCTVCVCSTLLQTVEYMSHIVFIYSVCWFRKYDAVQLPLFVYSEVDRCIWKNQLFNRLYSQIHEVNDSVYGVSFMAVGHGHLVIRFVLFYCYRYHLIYIFYSVWKKNDILNSIWIWYCQVTRANATTYFMKDINTLSTPRKMVLSTIAASGEYKFRFM